MKSSCPKLIQVFLSQTQTPGPNIYEVTGDEYQDLSCTCPNFRSKGSCKHVRFVNARIKSNGGEYPLEISPDATTEDIENARKSSESFREFVIKFGKIEVY